MNPAQDGSQQQGSFYDHFSEKEDFWFDFMADTGDGGNSSYSVARLLAQPDIRQKIDDSERVLPRGNLLMMDLNVFLFPEIMVTESLSLSVEGPPECFYLYLLLHMLVCIRYPNPSTFTYEAFFRPFEYALQPPLWYKDEHIAVKKPELPNGVTELKHYDGPQCFLIPGNHDWFDGLDTFMRYICHKSWLGDWIMPQQKSYFALQLPKRWWIFVIDLALHSDIDVYQFKFFSELISEMVGENDSVIIVTHEPNWLLDWYWDQTSGRNVAYLIRDHLKGRCKLCMAGDLHHYMRHSYVPSDKPVYVQNLLVNSGGGAFLHPTHVFSSFRKFCGTPYEMKSAYPSCEDSGRIALGNILKFRKKNWQYDFIGGIIYFQLVFSMFPQCKLNHILREDSFSGHVKSFFGTVWDAFIYLLEHSHVSSAAATVADISYISGPIQSITERTSIYWASSCFCTPHICIDLDVAAGTRG